MGETATLVAINPVIPAKNMQESLAFYEDRLGFTRAFAHGNGTDDGVTNGAGLVFYEDL